MNHSQRLFSWDGPRWWAHRGAGRMAPENTLAAFELGARCDFKAFECDVKISADGVAFLMHDTTLDRTTGELGKAEERNWAQLSQLDAGRWHSPAFEGVRIPKLSDIARFAFETDLALNIEIKPTGGHESRTGGLVALEAAELWRGPVSTLPSGAFFIHGFWGTKIGRADPPPGPLRD